MDMRTASAVANATDISRWCEEQAQEIDALYLACEHRPLSPQESRRLVDIHRESLRRMGQHYSLILTLYAPEARVSAPAAPLPPPIVERVPWWRRWLRRMVG